jgi:hypothetical protein
MEENEDYVRVTDDNEAVIRFDRRLIEALGEDPEVYDTARKVVKYVFHENGIAIGGFVVQLLNWMLNTDRRVSANIAGE